MTSVDTCNVRRFISKTSFAAKRIGQLFSQYTMQDNANAGATIWDPQQVFQSPAHNKYAVVILNRPIYWESNVLLKMWEKAWVTVTVDGGTHRWLDYLQKQGIDVFSGGPVKYVPHMITGDMDSASPVITKKLENIGARVIKTPDQDYTDYTKCLVQVAQYAKTENINLSRIYTFTETTGRFDHIIGNINTLYQSDKLVGKAQVIHITSNSLIWLLKAGHHRILIPKVLVEHNCWCGLLPLGSPVNSITTTGLKWNLNNSTMHIGGMISSSNTYDNSSEVTINTDSPLIWSMGIKPLLDSMKDHDLSYIRQSSVE